ncbi:MAG: nucleotide pyrophosphohydrolase [Planctomycetota bacterium]
MTSAAPKLANDQQTTIQDVKQWMAEFVAERNWERFHNAKNLTMSMAIETGELLEHFQWLTTEEVVAGDGFEKQEVEEEIADVACYLISLANALEVDLAAAIQRKMVKNRIKYPVETAE